jgi:transposase
VYTEAFKQQMVKKMLGPRAVSARRLSEKAGVSQPTLSQWKRDAVDRAAMTTPQDEKKPRSTREWTLLEKLRLLVEAHGLRETPEERAALLRREGVTLEQLEEWRVAADAALSLAGKRRGQKRTAEGKRIRELEAELHRKEKALAEAAALLILKKKAQALWGDEDDSTDEGSGK